MFHSIRIIQQHNHLHIGHLDTAGAHNHVLAHRGVRLFVKIIGHTVLVGIYRTTELVHFHVFGCIRALIVEVINTITVLVEMVSNDEFQVAEVLDSGKLFIGREQVNRQ